jgi:hypothetical protein
MFGVNHFLINMNFQKGMNSLGSLKEKPKFAIGVCGKILIASNNL